VLALDVDTMPGLALSLGAPGQAARLPSGLAERVEGKGWRMVKGSPAPAVLVRRFAGHAPDGVRYLELGKLPATVEPDATVAFRHLMERFRARGWAVIADLAAGTRQPMFRWVRFAEVVVVVVDASVKSTLTARRLLPVATHLVANKVRSQDEVRLIRAAVPLPLLGTVPYDEELLEGERRGLAPIDFAPGSAAVRAAGELAARLSGDAD
jgi:CO dehydrogenase maturation factor